MSDIRLRRQRVSVAITLWPADCADVLGQKDVIESLEIEELLKLKDQIEKQLEERQHSSTG